MEVWQTLEFFWDSQVEPLCMCVFVRVCACVCVCVKKMARLLAKLEPWTAVSALLGPISKVQSCVRVCVCVCACVHACMCVYVRVCVKKMTRLLTKLEPWTAVSALLGLISKVQSYARA